MPLISPKCTLLLARYSSYLIAKCLNLNLGHKISSCLGIIKKINKILQIIFLTPVYRSHTYVKANIMQKLTIWRKLDQ